MTGRERPTKVGPPDPEDCRVQADVGRVHYDSVTDVWYECVSDPRHNFVGWAIVPSVDDGE